MYTSLNKKAQLTQGLRVPSATTLDIIKTEIAPFDPPTPKTLPRTKHGVDRMHHLRDIRL